MSTSANINKYENMTSKQLRKEIAKLDNLVLQLRERADRMERSTKSQKVRVAREELEGDMRRLLTKGVQLFGENKAEEAEPLFEEVIGIARDLGNHSVEGRAIGNLASVFEATGRHTEAIKLYEQSIEILKKFGDSRKEARILYNVSHSYLSLNRYDDALKFLNKSFKLTDDDDTRKTIIRQINVVQKAYDPDAPQPWTHHSYTGDENIFKDNDNGVYRYDEETKDYEIIGFYFEEAQGDIPADTLQLD